MLGITFITQIDLRNKLLTLWRNITKNPSSCYIFCCETRKNVYRSWRTFVYIYTIDFVTRVFDLLFDIDIWGAVKQTRSNCIYVLGSKATDLSSQASQLQKNIFGLLNANSTTFRGNWWRKYMPNPVTVVYEFTFNSSCTLEKEFYVCKHATYSVSRRYISKFVQSHLIRWLVQFHSFQGLNVRLKQW
jgi:hypothetical protein